MIPSADEGLPLGLHDLLTFQSSKQYVFLKYDDSYRSLK